MTETCFVSWGKNGKKTSQLIASCFGGRGRGERSSENTRMVPIIADLLHRLPCPLSLSESSRLRRPFLTVFSPWWTFWCWCSLPSWASSSSPTSFTCCDHPPPAVGAADAQPGHDAPSSLRHPWSSSWTVVGERSFQPMCSRLKTEI